MGQRRRSAHYEEQPPDLESVHEHVHSCLYREVGKAVQDIISKEQSWSQGELTKRIVRYIFKAASAPGLMRMHWQEAVEKIVDDAFSGYNSACGDRSWFWEIDLAPAFAAAAHAMLKWSRHSPDFRHFQDYASRKFEAALDGALNSKAMWECSAKTFQSEEDSVRVKVYNALHKAYDPALQECLKDPRKMEDIKRVELFTEQWLRDSMQRAWASVDNSSEVINEHYVLTLFRQLIAPFGDEHPFSCIPQSLTSKIGRPPTDWQFIGRSVKRMFHDWAQEADGIMPSNAKRRKTRQTTAYDDSEVKNESEEEARPEVPERDIKQPSEPDHTAEEPEAEADWEQDPGDVAGSKGTNGAVDMLEGHPGCTSQEDCIGTPDAYLVRHLLDEEEQAGDVYCEECWMTFIRQNKTLKAEYIDGPKVGQTIPK